MILLFDVGNSTIGIALSDGKNLLDNYRLTTDVQKTYDEYFHSIKNILDVEKITRIAISSVVPRVTEQLIKLSKKYFDISPFVLEAGVKTKININTDVPKEVGSDIICDCAGLEHTSPTLILDLGTANKYIYCKNNSIVGVIITPGVASSQKALVSHTALLYDVELKVPKNVLGRNTTECMQSGMTYGCAAQIDGLISRISEEVKEDFNIIGTGGLSSVILPLCKHEVKRDANLVFNGLLKIYNLNHTTKGAI
jgi:type III pantothenate kinase